MDTDHTGFKGHHHDAVTRRRMSARMKRQHASGKVAVLHDDLALLFQLGVTTVVDYAERAGCSRATAHHRLTALVDAGLADRYQRSGLGKVFWYVGTVPAGATVQS
jgi:Fic family protein